MRWPSTFSIFLLSLILLAVVVSGADVDRRQLVSVDADPTAAATESSSPSESESPSSSPEEPTPSSTSVEEPPSSTLETVTTSESPSPTSSPSRPTPTEPSPTPTPTPDEPTPTTPPSTPPADPSPTPTRDTPVVPPRSSIVVVTRTITSGDQTIIETTESASPLPTSDPATGKEPSSGDSGLSDTNKKVIIGVVVGVGGAILLGGLAAVIYRLRRKRNARPDPDEDDLTGTALGSHSHQASMTSSPFKTTLDQYHNPGPVNPASNF